MLQQNNSYQQAYQYPDTNKQFSQSNQNILQTKYKKKMNNSQLPYNYIQQSNQQNLKQQNKLYFKIQVIKKVGTFLQNLKAGIVFQKPNLKVSQLYYLQSQTKLNQKQKLIKYQNPGVILLQGFLFVLLIINLWKNSYQIVYSPIMKFPYIQLITLLSYLFYIYIFLNTQFKNQKMQIVSSRNYILNYYLNQKILYDIFIILGLILQCTPLDQYQSFQNIFRVSSILIIKPISQISKKLQSLMSTSTDTQIILSIMSLLFKILLLLHSLSLLLTTLSKIQKSYGIQKTWIDIEQLNIRNDIEQYIAGWYWASTVLSTVGFGDITPINCLDHFQRAFVSFIQVLGCIMSGFFVNFIGALINMVGQSKKNYQRDMRKVNRYLLKQQLPDHLKTNIRSHFFNKYKIQEVYDPATQQNILSKLSKNISSLITETRNLRILKLSKFITPFNQQTIRKLSMIAKKTVFAPQQIIFSQITRQKKLWIIEDGIVQQIPTFFNPKQDKAITIYDNTNERTMGWINFLTDKNYKTMARAQTFTLSYQMNQSDFFSIVRQNEQDFYKLHQLKQCLIQKKRLFINKCLSCQRFTHNVIDCPRVHFKSNGIYKILMHQKRNQLFKGCQIRKKNASRSKSKLNWKSIQKFTQITHQIEEIISKYSQKEQINLQIQNQRRQSIQSFGKNLLLRNKSINSNNIYSGQYQNGNYNNGQYYSYNNNQNGYSLGLINNGQPINNNNNQNYLIGSNNCIVANQQPRIQKHSSQYMNDQLNNNNINISQQGGNNTPYNNYIPSQNIQNFLKVNNQLIRKNSNNIDYVLQMNDYNVNMNYQNDNKNLLMIKNMIDRVYLGQCITYMQNNNFNQISKKYILYMINLCTNRNKI